MSRDLRPMVAACICMVACLAVPALASECRDAGDINTAECAWDLYAAMRADEGGIDTGAGQDDDLFSEKRRNGHGNDNGDDDDDDDDSNGRICLCFAPPGNPEAERTLCVAPAAACGFLLAGATLGPCEQPCGGEDGTLCDEGEFCKVPEGECDPAAEGICTDLPNVCTGIYDPVCGCDGRTYSSECYAETVGAPIASTGVCEPDVCGGEAGDTCDEDQFCVRPAGECSDDAEGVCATRPQICPDVFAPVCGCDGMTYSSRCQAFSAGVSVEHDGECSTETACGGAAGESCADDEFCKRPAGECDEDAEGVCAPRPQTCPGILAPVCGCDGTTYDNACVAENVGVTIENDGECATDGRACGGAAGDTCSELQSCLRPEGECAEDAEGICVPKPLFCPPLNAPVCGCDGETYSSACVARAVGVTVASQGECAPKVCGGTAGDTCDEGEFCDFPDGECAAGAVGFCTAIPGDCPADEAPVCGCDGMTYDNACLADLAGVTVEFEGACGAPTVCGGAAGDSCSERQSCLRPEGECAEDAEGICVPKPLFCPPLNAPVCGCDGETYSSACVARAVGVTVASQGECAPAVCGGTAGDTCGEGEFCDIPDGECAAGAVGFCASIPADCPADEAPVCGCDGMTYDNACLADLAGVTVEFEGACGAPTVCGGGAGDSCSERQSCLRPEGECAEDAEGICVPKPLFCPPLNAPVCGCDGETYSSACVARAVGVTVASQGECAPAVCGGTAGDTCGEGEFCDIPDGECAAGAVGFCTAIPGDCPADEAPVCGCDGMTYDNACLADLAGVTVEFEGACGAPTVCGGAAGDSCSERQSCLRPEGECAEDAEGICVPKPLFCPPLNAPVCGCDGETYSSACVARAVGVTVASQGECAPTVCGGTAGDTCGAGEFCDIPDGECAEGAVGVCASAPADCPAEEAPVCGCDGTTYDNACLADAAGVTVESDGMCTGPTACGGSAGDTCAEHQYCARPEGECAVDAEGVCAPRALFCPPLNAPVCGCDGETYTNACIARALGITVASQGECASPTTSRRGRPRP